MSAPVSRTEDGEVLEKLDGARSALGGVLGRLRVAFWLRRCRAGHHAPLLWLGARERRVPIPTNTPRLHPVEAFYAAGGASLAKWNGWCPRCGSAVEWADHDPVASMHGATRFAAITARRLYRASVATRDATERGSIARPSENTHA